MSNKLYALIVAIVTGVEAIACGLVTYFNPPAAAAVNAAIPIVGTAIMAVCKLFVKDNKTAA